MRKMKNIKMVVLDMAGTTVDEQNVVYKTLQKAINHHGVSVSLDTVLEVGAGKEKFQAIKDVLAHAHIENIDLSKVFSDFKTMLNEAYKTLIVRPVAGVEQTMRELRKIGVIVVLNTGYNSKIANDLLKKLSWQKGIHYDALITSDDVENGRPQPDMILKAMEMFGLKNPALVLKAGDSVIDIEEGKNANCGITLGVLSGAQTREQLEKTDNDGLLNSVADLIDFLKES